MRGALRMIDYGVRLNAWFLMGENAVQENWCTGSVSEAVAGNPGMFCGDL